MPYEDGDEMFLDGDKAEADEAPAPRSHWGAFWVRPGWRAIEAWAKMEILGAYADLASLDPLSDNGRAEILRTQGAIQVLEQLFTEPFKANVETIGRSGGLVDDDTESG